MSLWLWMALTSAAAQEPSNVPEVSDPAAVRVVTVYPPRVDPLQWSAQHAADRVDLDRRQALSLPDALRETPGIWMQETHRGSGTPFVRGLSGPQNLVVVDGVVHNLSVFRTGPNQYAHLIDPFFLQRVEVLRGPEGVRYGDGAMGGVIRLTTAGPDLWSGPRQGWKVNARGQVGLASADVSPRAAADVSLTHKSVGLVAGVSGSAFGALRTGADETLPLSSYQQLSWRVGAAAQAKHHLLRLTYLGGVLGNAGRTDALPLGELRSYDNQDHLVTAAWQWTRTGVFRSASARVAWHHWTERQDRWSCEADEAGVFDQAGCVDRVRSLVRGESLRTDRVQALVGSGEASFAGFADRLRAEVGLDGRLEGIGSAREDRAEGAEAYVARDRGNFSDGSRFGVVGLFARTSGELVRSPAGVLAVHAGARFTTLAVQAPDVPLPNAAGEAQAQPLSTAVSGWVGTAAVQWQVPGWGGARASWQQGFRAPNLEELTILGPEETRFSVPNAGLRPERNDTAELTVWLRRGPVRASVTGYMAWLEDALDDAATTWEGAETSAEGLIYSQRVNVPGGRYVGVEAEASADAGPLNLRAQVTWTRGRLEGAPARRVPPAFGLVGARWDSDPTARLGGGVELFTRVAAAQRDLSGGDEGDLRICAVSPTSPLTFADQGRACPGSDGWATVNLRGSFRVGDTTLAAALYNVADTRYRVHGSGIDAAGIDARLTLSTSL